MRNYRVPMKYQGSNKVKNYFEGWYYKLVNQNQEISIAFIPGISLSKDDPHSFIQVFVTNLKTQTLKTEYIRYSVKEFEYDNDKDIVKVGSSKFGLTFIDINIEDIDLKVNGEIYLSNLKDIQRTFLSPSIMGFFRYIPKMECYHGIVSMDHSLKGSINYKENKIDFNQGKGYIEKDWGTSFPETYTWMQSNHFTNKSTSFMLSYARIPFLGLSFKGFLVNLVVNDKEYRFGTYNFSRVTFIRHDEHRVEIKIKKGNTFLHVIAKNKDTVLLPSPRNGSMDEMIKEGLSGIIEVKLFKKNKLIFEDTGTQAGLEIMLDK